MANEPEITIAGNLTADPETKFTNSGTSWTRFTIATTPRSFDRETNRWKDGEAMFMPCTAWRQLGENTAETLTMGTRVIVTGRLKQRHWETDQGEKRSAFGVDVEDVGTSLKWATATVRKAERNTGNTLTNAAEMWGGTPITSDSTSSKDDKPPF